MDTHDPFRIVWQYSNRFVAHAGKREKENTFMSANTPALPVQTPKKKKTSWGNGEIKRHISFFTMLLPGTIFLLVFSYLPMPALILAFKQYQLTMPPKDFWIQNPFIYSLFVKNPWVGFKNFEFLFTSPDVGIFMRNTIGYNLMFMAVGLVIAVTIAVGINELRQRFAAKMYHTILFMPFFLSWIIITYILYALISSNGVINKAALVFGMETTNLYAKTSAWPFILLIANIWRYSGNNSIIYLATLSGFNQELYEAGAIDGAGKLRQFIYITLPQLIPTIILLQILAVGRIINSDFDMFYSLPNGSGTIREATLTIDVYVFNALMSGVRLGLPAAAGLFQSFTGFVLVLITNGIVRKVNPESAMF